MRRSIWLPAVIMAMYGCASSEEPALEATTKLAPDDDIPNWVFSPTEPGGLASAACIAWSGDMQVDRPYAIAEARSDLVQQIGLRVSVMDKTYARRNDSGEGISTGGVFERVSKQIAEEYISQAIPKQTSFATIGGVKNLCALVTMDEAATNKMFADLVDQSGVDVDPQSEAALYEEFRAKKAQAELQEELDRMNNT